MSLKENNLILIEVENEGFVAAGRAIAFPAPESTSIIALPERLVNLAQKGMIKTLTISGNSLAGIGIFDGDRVVCKKAFSKKEISNDTICIVYIPSLGETVAKKIRFIGDHMVLKSCNDEVPDMKVKPAEVEIRGVVIELHRKPDELGRFDRGYVSEFPF